MNDLARQKDWEQLNKHLMRYFVASGTQTDEVLKHSAMKYFICFTTKEANFLESPM
jgi:hypothetical protein